MRAFLNEAVQVPADTGYKCDPENTQQKFSEASPEFQAECHSIIFSKVYEKPITNHMKLLAEIHVSLDPDFKSLVKKKNTKNNQNGASQKLKIENW